MKVAERLARLAIISVVCIVVSVSGCDEGMTIGKTIMLDDDTPAPIPTTQAELKADPGETGAGVPQLDREKILAFPGEDATPEEFDRHAELAKAAAVNVNVLDISGCAPNPLVIEVGYGESIEIKNSDEVDHTLYFGANLITILAGGSRWIVVTNFLGSKEGGDGFAGYGCDDAMGGIFYVNPNLVVEPSEKHRYVTFRVVESLFWDVRSSPSIEGVRVTVLDGSDEVKETAADGRVAFRRDLPLTVRLEKEGYITTEVTVLEEGEEIVLPSPVLDSLVELTTDRIISDGSVDSEILAEVGDVMDLSRAYAKEYLGIEPPGCNVFIGTDPEWMAHRYFEAFGLNKHKPGWLEKVEQFSNCIPEGGPSSLFIVECNRLSSELRKGISAHEWWHTNVQYYFLNAYCCTAGEPVQITGPIWLMEGSAEVWSWLIVHDSVSLDQQAARMRQVVPADVNLVDLNTWDGWLEAPAKYETMFVATYMLVETTGWTGLLDFYKQLGEYFASEAAKAGLDIAGSPNALGPGMMFRNEFFASPERYQKLDEIFQSAFGRTMEEFAVEFRASLQ